MAFYPADWSPIWGDQVALYNEILPVFRKCDAELLDSVVPRGPLPVTVTSIFRCSPISRPRARSQRNTARPRAPALAPITLVEYGDYARIARWRIP